MKILKNIRISVPIGIVALIIAGLSFLAACKKDIINQPAATAATDQDVTAARVIASVTRYPLFIPSAITTSSFNLTAAPGTHDLGGGTSTKVWQYNGSFPAPTIIATKGDVISATYKNN